MINDFLLYMVHLFNEGHHCCWIFAAVNTINEMSGRWR